MSYMDDYRILQKENSISLLHNSNQIAEVCLKNWELEKFNMRVGSFNIQKEFYDTFTYEHTYRALEELVLLSRQEFELIELHLVINHYNVISAFEQLGFRLVDSRIDFITLMKKNEIEFVSDPEREVMAASEDDLQQIIDLTTVSFTNNPDYYSRFKNRNYFTEAQSNTYFSAWITNNFQHPDSYSAVIKENKKTIGYFIYRKDGTHNDIPLYKGIMTAVHPDYRGKNLHIYMQSFLYKLFPDEEFYLYNGTQLTNKPVITNHFKSGKRLNSVMLTFYYHSGSK